MSALKYWIWLTTLRGTQTRSNLLAIEHFGSPERIWLASDEELDDLPILPKQDAERYKNKDLDKAEFLLGECERLGVGILTIQDAAYPDRLREIYDPPCVLYVRGSLPVFDEEAALCVVGTRRATPYGTSTAMKLSAGLSRAGMLMVSGMAEGIDAAVHEGAMRSGCPSVAVLGGGIDVVYPRINERLYMDLCAYGAVLSECPPGEPVGPGSFPRRNRIISGLSLGTLVVEAPLRSGALITASRALEQGRDVFAVPGGIDIPTSAGCNRLIKNGEAKLTSCAEDVLEEYVTLFPGKLKKRGAALDITKPYTAKSKPETDGNIPHRQENEPSRVKSKPKILDISEIIKDYSDERKAILICIAGSPLHIDEITNTTGLSTGVILSELTILEMEGVIESLPGGRFVMKNPE